MRNKIALFTGLGALTALVACGDSELLQAQDMFGDVFATAFKQAQTAEPLNAQMLLAFATQSPLSLTTDPIDF